MKIINEMVAALYLRNRETMKFSNEKIILFISKLTFAIPIFAWLSTIIGIFDRYLFGKDILSYLPKGKYAMWPLVLIIYLLFDRVTWNREAVLSLFEDPEHKENLKPRVWQFWIITIIGFGLAAYIGYLKKWNQMP